MEIKTDQAFPSCKAITASIVIFMGCSMIGSIFAFPSPVFPKINSHPTTFRLDDTMYSWAVSAASIGGLIGGLCSQYLIDNLGRKCSLMLSMLPMSLGWLIMLAAQWAWMMVVGRCLTGFAAGITWVCSPIYVAEISPVSHRGLLMSLFSVLLSFGVLWTYVIGEVLPWKWLTVSNLALNVIMISGLILIPESPRWLLLKGFPEAAEESLKWFRGVDDVSEEMNSIKDNIQMANPEREQHFGSYFKREFYWPLLITLALFTIQICGGLTVMDCYTVKLFNDSGIYMNSFLATTIAGLSQFAFSVAELFFINRFGRRILLVISAIGMTICLLSIATYFKIQSMNSLFANEYLAWLPISSVVLYYAAFDLGINPIPASMMSELLPLRYRGFGGGIVIAWAWISTFLMTELYLTLLEAIDYFGTYILYASITASGAIFVIFAVPETKGKTLEEIEMSFQSN